jgi:regulator of sigma D
VQRYANEAIEKLTRIEQLWKQLRSTTANTLEYKMLVKEIGVLSMEYQDLTEAARKLEEQK